LIQLFYGQQVAAGFALRASHAFRHALVPMNNPAFRLQTELIKERRQFELARNRDTPTAGLLA
jgi:hypothetical protein